MRVGGPSPLGSPECISPQATPETAVSGELRSFAVARLALPIARREPQAAAALPGGHGGCSGCFAEHLSVAAGLFVRNLIRQPACWRGRRLRISDSYRPQ